MVVRVLPAKVLLKWITFWNSNALDPCNRKKDSPDFILKEKILLQSIEGSEVFGTKFKFEFPRNTAEPIATMKEIYSQVVFVINNKSVTNLKDCSSRIAFDPSGGAEGRYGYE